MGSEKFDVEEQLTQLRYKASLRDVSSITSIRGTSRSVESFVLRKIKSGINLSSYKKRAEHEISDTNLALIDQAISKEMPEVSFYDFYKYGPHGVDVWGAITREDNSVSIDIQKVLKIPLMELTMRGFSLAKVWCDPNLTLHLFAWELDRFRRVTKKDRSTFNEYIGVFFKLSPVNTLFSGIATEEDLFNIIVGKPPLFKRGPRKQECLPL